jgi:hypothetical protein
LLYGTGGLAVTDAKVSNSYTTTRADFGWVESGFPGRFG